MTARIDITGQRFGLLLVSSYVGNRKWACICDCGGYTEVRAGHLADGGTRSCGCGKGNHKHGHSRKGAYTGTYNSWRAMIERCTNPNSEKYATYGAVGITVCNRWLVFQNFLDDMGPRPPDKTIDRIDNNLGYYKGNCRWATGSQQAYNRR